MIQKQLQHKENTTRLCPERKAQNKFRRIRAKSLQFPTEFKQIGLSAIHYHFASQTKRRLNAIL
jgi:hypothetical protein